MHKLWVAGNHPKIPRTIYSTANLLSLIASRPELGIRDIFSSDILSPITHTLPLKHDHQSNEVFFFHIQISGTSREATTSSRILATESGRRHSRQEIRVTLSMLQQ